MSTAVTTWYLEMLDRSQLRAKPLPTPDLAIQQAKIPSPAFSRFLYATVGGDWQWIDRLSWSTEQWMAYLDRAELETWVAYLSGTPAGYVELENQSGQVEIAYFGLFPQFTGQQLGGYFLSFAIDRAWQMGAQRVWVHTCSLDSPYALRNYQARGFQIYKEEVTQQQG